MHSFPFLFVCVHFHVYSCLPIPTALTERPYLRARPIVYTGPRPSKPGLPGCTCLYLSCERDARTTHQLHQHAICHLRSHRGQHWRGRSLNRTGLTHWTESTTSSSCPPAHLLSLVHVRTCLCHLLLFVSVCFHLCLSHSLSHHAHLLLLMPICTCTHLLSFVTVRVRSSSPQLALPIRTRLTSSFSSKVLRLISVSSLAFWHIAHRTLSYRSLHSPHTFLYMNLLPSTLLYVWTSTSIHTNRYFPLIVLFLFSGLIPTFLPAHSCNNSIAYSPWWWPYPP